MASVHEKQLAGDSTKFQTILPGLIDVVDPRFMLDRSLYHHLVGVAIQITLMCVIRETQTPTGPTCVLEFCNSPHCTCGLSHTHVSCNSPLYLWPFKLGSFPDLSSVLVRNYINSQQISLT